ncbi:hypothetical protein CDAR_592891 [Caerostris darwini]|uniref:Reverse transcriptase domain-containing protein n=1 Tax=Caerostris darwini TaxID=1538125 RepID=A0AAV4URQ8_9ARAC|nr:hypothetical protein CDAR_592891 [Caerostris darwini]
MTVKLINSYLTSRNCNFRVENSNSSPRPIDSDVQQDSLLDYILFLHHFDGISKDTDGHLSICTDDTVIATTHTQTQNIRALQKQWCKLENWRENWKNKINPTKCAYEYL